MRGHNRPVFRILMVLALGAAMGGLAGQSARSQRPRPARAEGPAPIVLATVIESAVPESCLLAPREEDDSAESSGKVQANPDRQPASGERAKKKVIACG
ncbi:hypothetical protein [Rhodoblastus sp.]|uniref:hypothetical protein n=1 Tax=Rhodoblastus sp. TaxID=1962975 RepID=UPI003F98E735